MVPAAGFAPTAWNPSLKVTCSRYCAKPVCKTFSLALKIGRGARCCPWTFGSQNRRAKLLYHAPKIVGGDSGTRTHVFLCGSLQSYCSRCCAISPFESSDGWTCTSKHLSGRLWRIELDSNQCLKLRAFTSRHYMLFLLHHQLTVCCGYYFATSE